MARFLGHVLGRLVTPLGFDGTDFRNVAVDADGHVQVSAVSSGADGGAQDGTLNGTTPVTVVSAPAAGVVRTVQTIFIYNADTAAVTVTVIYDNGGADRIMLKATLQVGETLRLDGPIVLDETDTLIEAKLAGEPATTNPSFVASYEDT